MPYRTSWANFLLWRYMTQYNLIFEPETKVFESQHQWISAAAVQYHLWKKDPINLNSLICAGTQAWYGILAIDNDKLNPNSSVKHVDGEDEILYSMLTEITRCGEQYFLHNAVFNAYFGYMMKVMPYFFLDYAGDYDGWQAKGIGMMQHAYSLEPENPLAKAMYYESQDIARTTQYNDACKELWSTMTLEQWGDGEVQQYFFRILQGEIFCNNAFI